MSALQVSDVPAEVWAELRRSAERAPVGPAPTEPAERAAWWVRHAESDEIAERAYVRLHEWAYTTGQPAAVTAAIREAIEVRHRDGKRCRASVERVRESPR